MERVVLITWHLGMQKIAFNQLLGEHCGLTLALAKEVSDALLAGRRPMVEFQTEKQAGRFIAEARQLGVVAELVLKH